MFRPKMAITRCLKFGSYKETVVFAIIIIISSIDILLSAYRPLCVFV
jgi:hypothetical protein